MCCLRFDFGFFLKPLAREKENHEADDFGNSTRRKHRFKVSEKPTIGLLPFAGSDFTFATRKLRSCGYPHVNIATA